MIGEKEPPHGVLNVLYGVLFEPAVTFRALAGVAPAGLAAGLVLLVPVLPVLTRGPSAAGMAWLMVALAWALVSWLAVTAVLALVAELLGGRGQARGLLGLLGLARAPLLLAVPLELVAPFAPAWAGMGRAAALAWSAVLMALAVREGYRLRTGTAVAVLLLPLGAVLLVALATVLFGGLGLALFLERQWPGWR